MAENEVLAEGTEVEDSSKTPGDEGKETAVDELTKIFNNYESDVKVGLSAENKTKEREREKCKN